MKFISEYRDPQKVEQLVTEIKQSVTRPWSIMEVCGGQTHGLVKNGILQMLPEAIQMVHGPGCPVCVTPLHLIDKAIYLAQEKEVILCSFGDMLRVPGSEKSLLQAKAEGADIRILYSPLDAVKIASEHPDREVVFFAVGFETTAPANALSVIHAAKKGIDNYSILVSHVLVPPAIEAVMSDPETAVNGFLAAGHVMTIMGYEEYIPLTQKFKVPIVITGFEPVDLLQGILMAVRQLESGSHKLENQYTRVAYEQGNIPARNTIFEVFEIGDQMWRGIGEIPGSGYRLKEQYSNYDAEIKFKIDIKKAQESEACIAGQVLKGIVKPSECPMFGKSCTPENPLGAPMVSSEGACAAYYHYFGDR
jgi:hydrogenase expression/formation protein HypD